MYRTLIFQCLQVLVLTLSLLTSHVARCDVVNSKKGFIDFNVYPYLSDVDSDNVITMNVGASLPARLSYFSLINFGNANDESELEDTTTYYTEQNVRWKITEASPLDLTLQMNFRTGPNNDRHRLGVRWRLNDTYSFKDLFSAINLKYSINFHAVQFDDANVWQLEHVYRLTFPYFSSRMYLSGFVDHTFNETLPDTVPTNPIVSETQLGFRLVENLYLISEYRINQYRRGDVKNLAVGAEYKIIW